MNTPHNTPTNSPYMQAPDDIFIEACPDSSWPVRVLAQQRDQLVDRVELIDPHVFEQGNDGAYTRALERLALQLRDELAAVTTSTTTRGTS